MLWVSATVTTVPRRTPSLETSSGMRGRSLPVGHGEELCASAPPAARSERAIVTMAFMAILPLCRRRDDDLPRFVGVQLADVVDDGGVAGRSRKGGAGGLPRLDFVRQIQV